MEFVSNFIINERWWFIMTKSQSWNNDGMIAHEITFYTVK